MGASTFTATVRSSFLPRARYTSPIPPAPRGDRISYRPSLLPAEVVVSVQIQNHLSPSTR